MFEGKQIGSDSEDRKNSNIVEELEHRLQNNKAKMVEIMKSSPIAGVYAGEDLNQWHNFYHFYINFLKAEIGPRGQCSKAIRLQMEKDPAYYDQILKLLDVSHQNHIKDIYIKYKLYSPAQEYEELLKTKESLLKSEDSFGKISDPNSQMYAKIKQGLLDKHGLNFDYAEEIGKIVENYAHKIKKLKEDENRLQSLLDTNQNYLKFIKMKCAMSDFFRMWKQADQRVGFQSIDKGDSFEKKVREQVLPVIFKRAKIDPKRDKIQVVQNCRWEPRSLGEIDLAILRLTPENKWEAIVLIECKSRLFDVREAYKQVAVLAEKKKTHLSTILGLVEVAQDHDYFIVTTLPQFPFILPVESKMKEVLERSHKNKMISQIKSEQMFPFVREKMQEQLSPLDWFLHVDSDQIIVLSYD